MNNLEFKPFMFNSMADTIHGGVFELCADFAKLISDIANEKLPEIKEAWKAEMLSSAIVVYGLKETASLWTKELSNEDTHKALLINIKPIVKRPCKHEPDLRVGDLLSKIPMTKFNLYTNCKHCGVELVAEWSEKK